MTASGRAEMGPRAALTPPSPRPRLGLGLGAEGRGGAEETGRFRAGRRRFVEEALRNVGADYDTIDCCRLVRLCVHALPDVFNGFRLDRCNQGVMLETLKHSVITDPRDLQLGDLIFYSADVSLFFCSSVRLFVCSSVRLFVCSSVRLFVCSFVRLSGCRCSVSFAYSLIRSVASWPT